VDVETQFADEYSAWEEDPYTFAPAGGESGISVLARALPVIREIVLQHNGENVAVVSHKATIRLLHQPACSALMRALPRPVGPVAGVPERAGLKSPVRAR